MTFCFSDIVVPFRPAGVDVEINAGGGPVCAEPARTRADVDRLTWAIGAARDPQRNADAATMADALRDIKRMLADDPPITEAQSLAAIDAGVRAGRVTLFPRASRPAFSDGGAA